MRTFASSILLLSMALCVSSWIIPPKKKKGVQKFQITGTILETRSYCGGAAPPPGMLAQLATPTPIPLGKLFVKKGETNIENAPIIATIVADTSGKFSISLPAGTYCLVEEWKSKKLVMPANDQYQTVDTTCYRKLYNAADYQLVVSNKNVGDVKIIFHRSCPWNQPCINYNGPLPPMAHPTNERGKVGE